MSLFWRVFFANAALLTIGTLMLAVLPVTISTEIALTEVVVLGLGLAVMLAANLVLLRPLFEPLESLASRMQRLDLLRAGQQIAVTSPGEVGELEHAFNAMLTRLEAERRESGTRALLAQEEERARIARSLHDEVGQTLTGMLFQLKRLADQVPEEHREELGEAQQALRQSLEEVRRIAQDLRPELLDHLGLASALTSLSTTFERRTGIKVERRLAPDLPPLDPQIELTLYRVAQESLTNVARHSGATRVQLSLVPGNGTVVLGVVDDGGGFDGRQLREGGGLRGIRERALIAGGALAIKRSPEGGVEVRLEVPCLSP
jgi:two-component system sensor histidine kinase UhpB